MLLDIVFYSLGDIFFVIFSYGLIDFTRTHTHTQFLILLFTIISMQIKPFIQICLVVAAYRMEDFHICFERVNK